MSGNTVVCAAPCFQCGTVSGPSLLNVRAQKVDRRKSARSERGQFPMSNGMYLVTPPFFDTIVMSSELYGLAVFTVTER